MDAIKTDNLTKTFDGVTAVGDLTLTVAKGELFGLIGPDGAGKSTTLRMLAAIMEPTGGEAWVMGRHTVREAEVIKEGIGYMSQRFGLYPDLTVLENLHFYADIYGVPSKTRTEKIGRLLAFSNLTPFGRRRAGNLSGGMKQKLGLACALVHTPEILLLDEPTNGVDPVSRRDFWRIIYQLLKEGATIFVTTAYLDEADRCHRVGLIHKGRLLACDTPAHLRRLMKGIILEIRAGDPRKTVLLLRERIPMASVGLFGNRVHLETEDPGRGVEMVTAIMKQAGMDLLGIRQIDPSLEDVFVSVLGGEKA